MKYLPLILITLLPGALMAQESDNLIHPNSAELMAVLNNDYLISVNLKRAELELKPLIVSDSLTERAFHFVNLFIGIGQGDVPSGNIDHHFSGMGRASGEVTAQDVIKAHWYSAGNGQFPGIKRDYTSIGIGSIIRKEDVLTYVIFK